MCVNNFKTDIKEYLFNTANCSGDEKNIEEQYLKQTIKFISDWEINNQASEEGLQPDTESTCNLQNAINCTDLEPDFIEALNQLIDIYRKPTKKRF